jgi:FkbM family methyltransferase
MIQLIGEHSVDVDLLRKSNSPNVLDLGCRGHTLRDLNHHHYYIMLREIDIDADANPQYQLAISYKDGMAGVNKTNDPQATHITEGSDIPMMTIATFSKMVGVKHWDLIKMDIEGEEYNVLKHAKHPLATQVSVEFHAHINQTKEQLDELLTYLSQFYTIHNQVWESRHGAGYNYWDVLLIAK